MSCFKNIYIALPVVLLTGLPAFGELLNNPDFESGTSSWVARNCSIAAESTEAHSGSGAVYVYNRNKNWKGIRQNVLPTLQANGSGTDYTYSAWVKMSTAGSHTVKLKLRIIYNDGTTTILNNEVNATATDVEWSEVSNTKTISWSGTLTEAWLEIANETIDANYYVDDCSLTIPAGNNPPTFDTDPILKAGATAEQAYTDSTLNGEATDLDGDALTYSKDGGPSWLTIASDGALSGTPAVSNGGTNQFGIRVEDGNGGSDTATLAIFVTVPPAPPAFNSDPVIEANAVMDVPYTSTLEDDATDDNGDTLTFSKTSGPAWLSVAPDGSLSGTPSLSDLGLNQFNLRVQETSGSNDTATLEITVIEPQGTGHPHYIEPFETNHLWTTIWGKPGWSSTEWNAPQIRAATNSYAGEFPVAGIRHEQVLDVNGPVTNNFTGGLTHSNMLVDAMIQPSLRTDPTPPTPNAASQAAFYLNSNGKLVVFHSVYTGNFTGVAQQWTELSHAPIAEGQWIRLKVSCDYLSDSLRNDKYFSIELDGAELSSGSAYNTHSPIDEVADMGGTLFLCANSGNGSGSTTLSSLVLDGVVRMDDLTVSAPSSVTSKGTPFEWIERFYPGSTYEAIDLQDTDGDGLKTWEEYLAGTDPTDGNSAFIGTLSQLPSGDFEIAWPSSFSGSLAPYAMYCSTNLLASGGGWELLEGNILRDISGINRWVDPSPPSAPAVFYRPAIQNP
jgi:hypothetical protein